MSTASSRRLLPPDGDAYLRVQRVADGGGGCHLDVHVDDRPATVERAVDLGAAVETELDDVVVMRSPAGLAFCVVDHDGEEVRPAPWTVAGAGRVLVDQVCVDLPPERFEEDVTFWSALTGWRRGAGRRPEYAFCERPPTMPLRLLFQRLDVAVPGAPAGAHLDLACDDVDAATAVHERLGARDPVRSEWWTTLTDPAGRPYCLTRRGPDTGLVG